VIREAEAQKKNGNVQGASFLCIRRAASFKNAMPAVEITLNLLNCSEYIIDIIFQYFSYQISLQVVLDEAVPGVPF